MISKRNGCSCRKCRECCAREPGWFVPDEIPVAARYMGLTERKFFARYCAEHVENDVRTISPATKHNSTECIFLNAKGLCDIHPVKPYECRKVFGCEGPARHRRLREIITKMWR